VLAAVAGVVLLLVFATVFNLYKGTRAAVSGMKPPRPAYQRSFPIWPAYP